MTQQNPPHRLHPVFADRIAQIRRMSPPLGLADAQVILGAPVTTAAAWGDVLVEDHAIAGSDAPVPVRTYRPAGTAGPNRPCLLWLHGGGFRFGGLDMPEAHETAKGLTSLTGAVVVSVDYRLCVDGVHFPAPHNDVLTAFHWTLDHACDLNVDPTRIAIGGASAGGALAAGAAVRLVENHAPVWQLLLAYPVLHAHLPNPTAELADALALLPGSALFPAEEYEAMVGNYLGPSVGQPPDFAFAGDTRNLSRLPPVFIENAEFDTLRSSGELFATQLRAAHVPVHQQTAPGVLHGHLNVPGLDQAHRTIEHLANRLTGPPAPVTTRVNPSGNPDPGRLQPRS